MRVKFLFIFLSICLWSCDQKATKDVLRFHLNDEVWVDIPVEFNDSSFSIKNGAEHISLEIIQQGNKRYAELPVFETYFEFDESLSSGYWYDPSRGTEYRIPFEFIEQPALPSGEIGGKWTLAFGKDQQSYEGVLIINTESEGLTGTILTETGDYRYLHGGIYQDSLRMQTFDGSHLFLFTAHRNGDSLTRGVFYSGNHYKDEWTGYRNPDAELRASNEIIEANGSALSFELLNDKNERVLFDSSNFNAKLSIIQIMGTWCPNCMDESRVLRGLYEKHKHKGLNIMAVAFERHSEADRAWKAINKAKMDMGITYPIFFGGRADKSLAAEKFSFLDEVLSFPTTVFIDRSGQVVAVHSGFNGPATGEAYNKELELLDEIIEKHLN